VVDLWCARNRCVFTISPFNVARNGFSIIARRSFAL